MVGFARFLLFIQLVVIAAAIGAVVVFLGVIALGTLTGSSNINGGLAMGAAGLMPVGAIAGAILGGVFSWRMISRWDNKAILGGGFGLFGFVAMLVGGWFLHQELTDGNPYEPDEEPTVLIEWRLPELVPHNEIKPVYRYTMRSSYMDWTLTTNWAEPFARDDGASTILRFTGKIRWRVTGRIFQLWKFPRHDDRITVDLMLPRHPQPSEEFSPWVGVESAPGHAFRTRILPE